MLYNTLYDCVLTFTITNSKYNEQMYDSKLQKCENKQSNQCAVRHDASSTVSIPWHFGFVIRFIKQICVATALHSRILKKMLKTL